MPTTYTPEQINAEILKSKAMLSQTEAEGGKPFAGSTFESESKAGKVFEPAILSSFGAKSALGQVQGVIQQGDAAKAKMDTAKANAPEPIPPDMYEGETEAEKIKRLADEAFKASQSAYDNLGISYNDEHQAELQGLKNQWEQLKTQQEEVNKWNEAISTTAQLRSGEARYTPIHSADVIAQKKSQGIAKLQDLDSKYQAAVASAKAAFSQKNSELAYKKAQEAQKYYQDSLTEIRTQEKEARQIAKDEAEAMADMRQKREDNINQLVISAGKSGAPKEILKMISESPTVTDAVIAAGEYMQPETITGIVGEYGFYVKDSEKRGVEPLSFDEYQTRDANRKERVAAAASNPDRLLTVTETQALGMPFGTTASQAYGQVATKPPTEAQSRDALYGQRTLEANQTIDELESYVTSINPILFASASSMENTTIGNALIPDEMRQLRQAQRNFYNAVLRKESGAVISPTEFSEAIKQYFPRPGDDKKTLAQKRVNRETAISRLIKSAGPAFSAEMSVPSIAAEQEILSKNDPLGIGVGKTGNNPLGI